MAINSKNRRSKKFKKLFDDLPVRIQGIAKKAFEQFKKNPAHPSLNHHPLNDSSKGNHKDGSFAIHITSRYCAIYVPVGDTNLWYWTGSHEDYNNFTGSSKK